MISCSSRIGLDWIGLDSIRFDSIRWLVSGFESLNPNQSINPNLSIAQNQSDEVFFSIRAMQQDDLLYSMPDWPLDFDGLISLSSWLWLLAWHRRWIYIYYCR